MFATMCLITKTSNLRSIGANKANRLINAAIFTFIGVFALAGCSDPNPSAPACRVAPQHIDTRSGDAACIIRMEQALLVVRHRLSGKWDLPGGRGASDVAAQCTAHRETFEETGLNVLVGPYLGTTKSSLHLYACQQQSGFSSEDTELYVPDWARVEVSEIAVLDPFMLHPNEWRFGDQLILVRDAYSMIEPNPAPQPDRNNQENN